jgi:hypothetical protein
MTGGTVTMGESTPRKLVVDVEPGSRIDMTVPDADTAHGRVVSVVLLSKTGRRARIQISAPDEITIDHGQGLKKRGNTVDILKNR